ncbi:MAG: GNAT family protein [Eubacteriales bacterium]|nr:GNAT family protein [Eubacteriales bacterium]
MSYRYGKVRFRAPKIEDAEFFQEHMNESPQTRRELEGWVGALLSIDSEREYLRKQITRESGERYFCIEDEQGRLIGSCSIFDHDARAQKCTIGLFIAEPEARGKGCGGDALELLLLFAFSELNCRKVKLNVFSYNTRAIHLYEKKGFLREGVLREEAYTAGQWHDEYCYAQFREAWLARVRAEQRRETL